ncbi:MAG: metallophosphoesterase [Anaerovoracaceae bacterium]|jgi:predicted phosphodiesterase|nr:metallophosphoesterase [Anaerovoracaceae bacterium]
MRIGLFGDVHGNYEIFYDLLMHSVKTQNITAAFQVGDFGLSEKVLKQRELFELPVPLFVVDGNHEDFPFITKSLKNNNNKDWANHNLHYQSRGSVANIGDINAGFIGGAFNVDQRQLKKSGNYITNDDVKLATKNFALQPLDIVVSHSCPSGIGIGMEGSPFHRWGVVNYIVLDGYNPGPSGDYGETQLTNLWNRMKQRPKLWVFGHFHQYQSTMIDDTQFLCLPRVDIFHQCVVWDTDTGEITMEG